MTTQLIPGIHFFWKLEGLPDKPEVVLNETRRTIEFSDGWYELPNACVSEGSPDGWVLCSHRGRGWEEAQKIVEENWPTAERFRNFWSQHCREPLW